MVVLNFFLYLIWFLVFSEVFFQMSEVIFLKVWIMKLYVWVVFYLWKVIVKSVVFVYESMILFLLLLLLIFSYIFVVGIGSVNSLIGLLFLSCMGLVVVILGFFLKLWFLCFYFYFKFQLSDSIWV